MRSFPQTDRGPAAILASSARDGDATGTGTAALPAVAANLTSCGSTLPSLQSTPRRYLSGRSRLGSYHLIAPLAHGAQAEVWKAVRTEPIVETVAIKLLYPVDGPILDPIRLARLRREAERGARLSHPTLLPIYEFGIEQEVAYMVMPLVEAFTLTEVLQQRCRCRAGTPPCCVHRLAILPERPYQAAMVRILATIACGLQAVHNAGVVHRDVKPGNILIESGPLGRVYLIDFGLARDLDAVSLEQLRAGEGTLRYMAPEKLLGRQVDEIPCDLFALGMTLFEALTLLQPRSLPPSLPRTAWPAYLAGKSLPRAGVLRPGLPDEIDAILTRAVAHDPGERYSSAAALAADLECFLSRAERSAGNPCRDGLERECLLP